MSHDCLFVLIFFRQKFVLRKYVFRSNEMAKRNQVERWSVVVLAR